MRIAMLHTRVRVEERLLLEAFDALGIPVEPIDLGAIVFDLDAPSRWREYDLVFDRSLSLSASLAALHCLESFGVRCVNSAGGVSVASDKLRTSLALVHASVPTPRVCVAPEPESGLAAVESIGYPAVLKPTVGSWGRLMARVHDRDGAEAVIEHRATLGSAQQRVVYAQEHIDKPGRDLRVFVVGGEAIAAISRTSAHWITNTARAGTAAGEPVTPAITDIATRAVACVGLDLGAVDLFECPRRGLLVGEVNHSMEFRNSIATTGVDIPRRIAEHIIAIAEQSRARVEVTA
ncbi:MAG: lysine biosynthesis protein LysX [Phycisphaerales bacterium]